VLNQIWYLKRYGVAIASVLIALLLMLALTPFLQLTQASFLLFFGAVTISAFYGGQNPGIVATLLSAVFANYFFLDTQYSWTLTLAGGLRLALFILEGVLISVLVGGLHTAQARLHQNITRLQASEADVKDLNKTLQCQVDELQALAAAKLASDDLYHILVESMDEGFCLCEMLLDEDGSPVDYRFLEVNPVFESLTGLKQVVGKTARELVPDLENFWFETYGKVALARESIRFEQRSVPMRRWFDLYAFPVGKPQHHLFGILFTNITERKLAEQERERFLAVSSDLQVITSINGYFQWVSPAFERILGWAADEMTSRPWIEFVHPDDVGKSLLETDHLFSGNETISFENRYQHQDGSYRWFLWNARPYLEEQVIFGAAVDITERKHAEEDLRESERRFRRLVESNMFGVAFGNSSGEIHYVNNYFLNMIGYTRAELEAGQVKWTEITPPEFLHLDEQAIAELKVKGVATPFEKEYIRKDGSRVPILIGSALLQETYDQHQEMIAFYLDLTDRKQAENVVLQLNQQLQEKVNELQTLLNVIPVSIGIGEDRECRYIRANPAFARLLNVPPTVNTSLSAPQEERPTTFKVYQNGQEMAPEDLPMQYAAAHGVEVHESEIEIVRQDGTALALVGYAAPLLDELGQPRGSVAAFLDITARKQAETALREKEQQLQQLSDSMPQFVWVCNAQGELEYVNLKWVEYSGLTIQQSQNPQQIAELYHPEDRQLAFDQWAIALETRQPFEIEARLQRAVDQTYRWFLIRAVPQFDEQGQVLRWIGTSTDIHDRKQLEQTLQQREIELRLVTNAIPALISFVDSEQCYRFNNQTYEEWFGEPAAAVYGKHLREVLGDSFYEEIRPYVEQVLAGQQVTFETQTQASYKDGATRYIRATYVPRFNHQKSVEGFVALVSDITDRKQAETSLRLSEDRYRTLANAVSQLMWVNDAQGNIQLFNQQWQEYTGVVDLELGVGLWVDIIHPDDFQVTLETRKKAIQAGEAYEVECRLKRADQIYRWHLARVVPHKDDRGQILSWFGTATDIDDRKQVEQEREQLLVREQVAREQAEAANRIKDEFLAVVSHELRSPLNPILGWSKLLQTRRLDEQKTQSALNVIARNAQMQAQLINDLLDVSRILRGKLSLNRISVDLVAIIQAALETVRLAAEAKSIQINTALDPEVGQVSGDPDRLQQVVWNLLSNAVKFTPQEGRVDLQLKRFGRDAQITITDTGKGIHPDFLPHVFDRFRQEDAATTRQFGGLGLGLALVRYLVEMHGGTVQAESAGEGQGATFTVKLPLIISYQSAINPQLEPSKPKLDLNSVRILVVDDDNSTREFIAFLLELHGANVIAVATADDAIATLAQFKPDLLLSDIGMPDRDGYMLMRQVRALPPEQGGQIPAIALTAYAGEINHQQAMAAGFQKHIVKPVEPETLVTAIAKLVMK